MSVELPMAWAGWPLQPLAQVGAAAPPPLAGPVAVSLAIAFASACALGLAVLAMAQRRRRDREELDDLAERYRFTAVVDDASLARVRGFVDVLFGPGPRMLRVLGQRTRGLDFFLVYLKIPLFRVEATGEWDERLQESQEKLVLFVTDFEVELPTFRLMPNSWAMTAVRGKEGNVFAAMEPFGYFNYVIAGHADASGASDDRERVTQVLAGEPMRLLRRNKQVTIDSRSAFLAFYLQNERPQPPDLPGFLEKSLQLSSAIRERAERLAVGSGGGG